MLSSSLKLRLWMRWEKHTLITIGHKLVSASQTRRASVLAILFVRWGWLYAGYFILRCFPMLTASRAISGERLLYHEHYIELVNRFRSCFVFFSIYGKYFYGDYTNKRRWSIIIFSFLRNFNCFSKYSLIDKLNFSFY